MEKQGHGTLSLHNAIVHSCDVFFFSVGARLGIDNLARYADMVGFGHSTGVDLPGEVAGTVPTPAWLLHNHGQRWYAGETPPVAVGQGALTVTPLQLARAIGGLAMGGVWRSPHLVRNDATAAKKTEASLDPSHIQDVIDAMYGVVNEGGTGAPAAIPGLELCGKTGTAQLASLEKSKAEAARRGGLNLKENAWFVGFAPRRAPEIVVVALFDHGGVGQYAATIVRDVVKSYFDKKTRLETWRQERSTVVAGASFLHPPAPEPRNY
jgi:penicillin-binding protein 2